MLIFDVSLFSSKGITVSIIIPLTLILLKRKQRLFVILCVLNITKWLF